MATLAIANKTPYKQVVTQALALSPEEQSKLIIFLAEKLPPSLQVQLILRFLPSVAPTMNAVLQNKSSLVVGGTTPESARKLIESWLAEPATEEDAQSWDEIMHNSPYAVHAALQVTVTSEVTVTFQSMCVT